MKLTGTEVRNQEFSRKMRGYSRLDVDAFLQLVGDAVDGLIRTNEDLTEQISELASRVKKAEEREALLERSLQAMNDLREDAKVRTDALLKTAQDESQGKIRLAEEEAVRIREEAEWSVRRVREDVESLESTRQRALEEFVEFLRSQLHMLENEADRLGIELPTLSNVDIDKIVSINKKVEGEEA